MNQSLRRVLYLTFFLFFFSTLLRVVFFYAFRGTGGTFSAHEVAQAFLTGARFDIRVSLLYSLPVGLLGLIPWFNPHRSERATKVWHWFYLIFTSLFVLTYFFDIGHYSYLQGRINVTILLFLQDPLISAQMMWETYNMVALTALFLAVIFGVHVWLKKFVFPLPLPQVATVKSTWPVRIGKAVLVVGLYLLGLHNSFGQYPLRWSDAFFANNGFITSLAMNPVHYFFDTLENPEKNFDESRTRQYYSVMARYLGIENQDDQKLNFYRPVPSTPRFTSQPNVIYIVMESMAAYKTGLFGNLPKATPVLDRLANQSWLFTNFYTPTEGTARSLFCVLTSLPDINAKSTSSRNPMIINQNSLFNAFQGYEKMYFIGGSAAWGNIRGVYKNNIAGLKMYEDSNLEGPRTDVWGLSDLQLFREAARIIKQAGDRPRTNEPFVAVIQTAGFHRPYTIPKDHGDFELETLSPEELKKYGWSSNEEYNSLRFQDYSLGEFIKLISNEPYFKNTLIVIHGDHGLPSRNAEFLPEGYRRLELNRFHVPLLIYSPLIEKPERFDMMATEMDVLPTLVGLTGHEALNNSLGRNLFALKPTDPNYAWSYVYYANPLELFVYDQRFLVRGTPDGAAEMYEYNSPNSTQDVRELYPEKYQEMSQLLLGFYETGKWLIFNNAPQKSSAP